MNWLDITLLCLAGIGFVKGLFDGIIKQVVSLKVVSVTIMLLISATSTASLWRLLTFASSITNLSEE